MGVVKQQIRGNDHPLPPTRSTPKPHVSKVILGVLSLFFDARFEFSCRLRGELALRVWWFGHRKSTISAICGIGKKKMAEIVLDLAGNPLFGRYRLSTASSPPSKHPKKTKVVSRRPPPCGAMPQPSQARGVRDI